MLDDHWCPEADAENDPALWAPLEAVVRITAGDEGLPTIHPSEFMLMGRLDRPRRPRIWLYKHIDTRRYLNLDDASHAYRYIGYERGDLWVDYYRPHRELHPALDHLQLWLVDDGCSTPRRRDLAK